MGMDARYFDRFTKTRISQLWIFIHIPHYNAEIMPHSFIYILKIQI